MTGFPIRWCILWKSLGFFTPSNDQVGIIHPKMKTCWKWTHPRTIPDVDEFVSLWKKIWRILALHHLLNNGSSEWMPMNESPSTHPFSAAYPGQGLGDPKAFPGQPRDIHPPACTGSHCTRISLFWSLPRAHDHRSNRELCLQAHLYLYHDSSVQQHFALLLWHHSTCWSTCWCSNLPWLVNKIPRCLNSFTWESNSRPTQSRQSTLFWMRDMASVWIGQTPPLASPWDPIHEYHTQNWWQGTTLALMAEAWAWKPSGVGLSYNNTYKYNSYSVNTLKETEM